MANHILIRSVCSVCHCFIVFRDDMCKRCYFVIKGLEDFEKLMDQFYGKLPGS